jgi:hypothetical protein
MVLADLGFYPRLMAMPEQVWGAASDAKSTSLVDFEPRLLDHKARFFRTAGLWGLILIFRHFLHP